MCLAIVKACRVTSPASAKLSENPLNFSKPPPPKKKEEKFTHSYQITHKNSKTSTDKFGKQTRKQSTTFWQ